VPSSSGARSRDPRHLAHAAWSRYGVAYTAATRRPAPPWLLDKLTTPMEVDTHEEPQNCL